MTSTFRILGAGIVTGLAISACNQEIPTAVFDAGPHSGLYELVSVNGGLPYVETDKYGGSAKIESGKLEILESGRYSETYTGGRSSGLERRGVLPPFPKINRSGNYSRSHDKIAFRPDLGRPFKGTLRGTDTVAVTDINGLELVFVRPAPSTCDTPFGVSQC